VLSRGLTAIEIGEKYKKLNKDAFIPGHFIRQYANKPVNDRMELRFEIEITHFPTPVFFFDEAFLF